MALTINGCEERLDAIEPSFRCRHLNESGNTCNLGCYMHTLGGPWICSNPDCKGHPSKYTDPCFGTQPWIFPVWEMERWDDMREQATELLPAAGDWALEIVLDGTAIGEFTSQQLSDLAKSYEKRKDEEPGVLGSIVDDVERCAAELRRFEQDNPHPLPDAGPRDGDAKALDRADDDERLDEEQLRRMLEASLATEEQDRLARQQRRQEEQDNEEVFLREQLAKIALVDEQERQRKATEQRDADCREEEELRKGLAASVQDLGAHDRPPSDPLEDEETNVRGRTMSRGNHGSTAPLGLPPSYDEIDSAAGP